VEGCVDGLGVSEGRAVVEGKLNTVTTWTWTWTGQVDTDRGSGEG